MDNMRQQVLRLEAVHNQNQQAKLDRWTARKPEVKQYIEALSQSKALLIEDIKQTEARINSAQQPVNAAPTTPARAARPGSTSHFASRSDTELATEMTRMRDALIHINGQILSTKAIFTKPTRQEEKELWETQLVILQVAIVVGVVCQCHVDYCRSFLTVNTGHIQNASGGDRPVGSGSHQQGTHAAAHERACIR